MIIALSGVVLCVVLFQLSRRSERSRIELEFHRLGEDRIVAVQSELTAHLEAVASMRGVVRTVGPLEERWPDEYAQRLLAKTSGLVALGWQSRMPAGEKAPPGSFEHEIRWHTAPPSPAQSSRLAQYVQSSADWVQRRELSAEAGKPCLSGPIPSSSSSSSLLLVAAPVVPNELRRSNSGPRNSIAGYSLGVLEVGAIFRRAMKSLRPGGVDIQLEDISGSAPQLLHSHVSRTRSQSSPGAEKPAGFSLVREIEVLDRRWRFTALPAPSFVAERRVWQPWSYVLGGLLLTAFVTRYYLAEQSRLAELDRLNVGLKNANQELETRVAERTESLAEQTAQLTSSERSLKQQKERLSQHNRALMRLAEHRRRLETDRLDSALRGITETASEAVCVDRASVWMLEPDGSAIRCFDLYNAANAEHSSGLILRAEDYPNYFRAMREQGLIEATDARTDPRTSEFTEAYLKPLGIGAMLDSPIWSEGRVTGVVCHEHLGGPREWTPEEANVAQALADLVSLACEITERKAAESQLRLLGEALAQARSGVVITDAQKDNAVIYCNQGFTRLTGHEAADVIGKNMRMLQGKETDPAAVSAIRRALEQREEIDVRIANYNQAGQKFWNDLYISPIRNERRQLTHFVGIQTDVTERVQAQEEFDRFFLLARDLFCTTDADGRFRRVNGAFAETLGYGENELLGRSALELVHPDDRALTLAAWNILADNQPMDLLENRVRCADGAWKWLQWSAVPYVSEGLIYASARDVTRQREAGESLRRSEAQLRELTENIDEGFWLSDYPEPRLRYSSPACARIFGLPERMQITDPEQIFERIHEEDRPSIRDAWMELIDGGRPDLEYRVITRAGAPRWVRDRAFPLRDSAGDVYRICGLIADITERREAEQALVHARDEAQQANRAKSVLLSRMSHELRTPLNGILGFAQLLEENELPGAARKGVDRILKAGRHLLNLIDEVLDISKVETGRLEMQLRPTPLAPAIADAVDWVRSEAVIMGVEVNVTDPLADELGVMADERRLRQVLMNLIDNGVKYNRRGGWVEISAHKERDGFVQIVVVDNGSGMTPQELEQIFVPFERLDAAARGVEGKGLGLSLARNLAEAMGGSITVESVPNNGSAFILTLDSAPLAIARDTGPADLDRRVERPGPENDDGRAQLLYIEDNPDNLALVRELLEGNLDVRVLGADNGAEGLDLARQLQPEVIFLDLHLPDMHGRDILRELRSDPLTKEIPVVILSADAMPDHIARLLDKGVARYLTKPLDVRELLSAMETLLPSIRRTQPI